MKKVIMETTLSKWPPRTLAEFKHDEEGNENTAGLAELAIIEARLKQRMSQAASSPAWHPSVFLLKRDKPDGKLLPQWPAPKPKRSRSRVSVIPAYVPADPAPVHVPRVDKLMPELNTMLDINYAVVDYYDLMIRTKARIAVIQAGWMTVWIENVKDHGVFDAYVKTLRPKPYPGFLPELCKRAINAGEAMIAWCREGISYVQP